MKKLLFLIASLAASFSFGQNFKASEYPKGVYETYEDFRSKTPSSDPKLSEAYSTDNTAYRFDNLDNKGKREKKAFAISDGKGNLYIHIINLIKKFNADDRGQGVDGGIYYLKAKNVGGYLFVKDYFTSNSAAMWGGLIAAAAARREKVAIFEEEKESFNLFKNTDDFKKFMEVSYPNISLELEKQGKGDGKESEAQVIERNLAKITPTS
ncbi:hypothetical protein [Elizabethkingia ursingii]|jgi:hypothetical protein|uniref:hypothetical protein n=1 Tax=Elizabethkingia ursingii TaxID=1756150 RepID=UPI002012FAAB|nr:hypothetical protein [Elizabethkingia ursingii]MCL1666175.1 hypothetical protein [Elizabethkingia ursingii]